MKACVKAPGCALVIVLAGGAWARGAGAAALTQESVDAQYGRVLAAMRHPVASGILVTEIEPDSAAGAAGVEAGDILVAYGGVDIRTLAALRQAVADNIAARLAPDRAAGEAPGDTVALTLRRAGNPAPLTVHIARDAFGIRAMEVNAAVAVAGNPPPSPRGSVKMHWDALQLLADPAGGGNVAYFRTHIVDGHADAWRERGLTITGRGLLETRMVLHHVDASSADSGEVAEAGSETATCELRTGDGQTSPPFLIESLSVTAVPADGHGTAAHRAGRVLRVTDARGTHDVPFPLDSLVSVAVPTVAAAMPHDDRAVLGLHLLSVRDDLARPGYVLAARGKQTVPGSASMLWRVDLLHCGMVIDAYWFDDNCRLIRTDTPGGTRLYTIRVASRLAAEMPLTPAPPAIARPPATVPMSLTPAR